MKKKNDLEGLEKWAIDVKKLMKNQPFVSDGPLQLVLSYWHDKRFLPKFCLSMGVNSCLDMFSWENVHVLLFPFRF